MLESARSLAAARQRHVVCYRSAGVPVRKRCRRLLEGHRSHCSQSAGEWHATTDGDWGSNVAGNDTKATWKPPIQAALLLAAGLAASFVLTRVSWMAKAPANGDYGQPAAVRSVTSIAADKTQNVDQDSDATIPAPAQGTGQEDATSAVSASIAGTGERAAGDNGAVYVNEDVGGNLQDSTTVEPGLAPEDHTHEPLLQHLFEDLTHRPPEEQVPTPSDKIHFEETSMDLSTNGSDAIEQENSLRPSIEAKERPPAEAERADELAINSSDLAALGALTGHDELQQRAGLAVRAAQAALRACESASAHSAASCRAASEAASAANNATHAASQALTAADRGATEDLERALRRVQYAQQQARDAEAAAATAATSAGAKAATAAEQDKLAQEAASPRIEEEAEQQGLADKAKAGVLRAKAIVTVWLQAMCTWCANAWQAFLTWTCRMGEHVQRLISKWQ
eukprot:jgi/Ulvmu1/4374/UM002_0099.1